ncbi:hypothetical protein [Sphingopyxis sp.]|uniref:hypothetical protein n=1 Tax=Sphingopyxis sp. TaxID=1908224 RepID=UPI003D0E5DA7
MSAIAAFLVLSTPSAFAQETPTITMTPPVAEPAPPVVAEPSTPAPVAAPQAAQAPVAAPVIRVPLDIAPQETASTPNAAERAAATPARAERTAQRAPAAVKASVASPVAAAATPIADPAPIEPVASASASTMTPLEPVVAAAPQPAETVTATSGEFPWEIAGGAAALLIVGGAGLAFARRRRSNSEVSEETPAYSYEPVAAARTTTADAWVSPAYAPREEAPVAPRRTTPAFTAAPSGSMGRHEAMAMAGPTDDNPFVTLNKRLKRARFLDRQERVAYGETLGQQKDVTRTPVSAWEIAQRPTPVVQQQEVRRVEPTRPRTTPTFRRPGYSNG